MPARYYYTIRLACLFAILLALPSPAFAQDALHLAIDRVDFSRFPRVDVVVSIRDSFGLPVQGLFAEHFSLQESGDPVTEFSVLPIFEQPLDLALVLDTSATTGFGSKPTPLQSAARAARNLVNSLGEEDRAAVVAFGDSAAIVQSLTSNKHPVNASLSLLEPAGNSALNDAILATLNLLKESKRPLILLFTDGPDSGRSQMSTGLVAQAAFQQGVPVFIIGWRTANTQDIQNLAALTGGTLQLLEGNTPAPEDLRAAINTLQPALKGLRGQYHITYTSRLQANDQEHPLQVQVVNQGHRQQAETAFTALSRQVAISMPGLQNGQVVGGIVSLAPQVAAPAPLASLELLVDGNLIARLDPLGPETAYDTALLAPGPHRLTTQARDIAGNHGLLELTLEVRPPVTVTLLSPAPGTLLGSETALAAKVAAIPELDRVEFWVDDQLIATRESTPYETAWDSSGLAAGAHQVRIVAYDVQGHRAEVTHAVTVPSANYLLPLLLVLAVIAGTATVIIVPLRLRRRQQQRDQELSSLFARKPACLREVEGLNPGRVWALEKDELRLGRKRDENDLPLKGLSAARQQAVIRYQEGDYVIFSLYPEKPVLVNEIPAHPHSVLKSGDTLRLGETVLHFEMQA